MNIDKRTLESLSSMSDDSLRRLLTAALGADTAVRLRAESLSGIRNVISRATDSDIARAAELFEVYKEGRRT